MPKIRLRTPRLDCQPAADADENDQHIGFEVGAHHDRDGHEQEYAQQKPIHVQPPCAVPIYIREIFLSQGPPDINDKKDGEEESAQQNGRVASPEVLFLVFHPADYNRKKPISSMHELP